MRRFAAIFLSSILFFLVAWAPIAAHAIGRCEIEAEDDGKDGDDFCAVSSYSKPPNLDTGKDEGVKCDSLQEVVARAVQSKMCGIDHKGEYGSVIVIADP